MFRDLFLAKEADVTDVIVLPGTTGMKFGCLSKSEVDRKRWALGLATRRRALRASSVKLRHEAIHVEANEISRSGVPRWSDGTVWEKMEYKASLLSDP